MLRLRKFMFDRVYLGPEARREHGRGCLGHPQADSGHGFRVGAHRWSHEVETQRPLSPIRR
jgi:hypothetical protein